MTHKSSHQSTLLPSGTLKVSSNFYSGDLPNRHLSEFVEEHRNARSDTVRIEPFTASIVTKRDYYVYNLHTYWSKKPHNAITAYIRHFTEPRDIVLDPFCGSGGTLLSALFLDRCAIGIDRSPFATFVSANYTAPAELEMLEKAYQTIRERFSTFCRVAYATTCSRCGGPAWFHHMGYAMQVECLKCLKPTPYRLAEGQAARCIHCAEIVTNRCRRLGFASNYSVADCQSGCKPAREWRRADSNGPFEDDVRLAESFRAKLASVKYPLDRLPEKTRSHTLVSRGVSTFPDLFTSRSLFLMCKLWEEIEKSENAALIKDKIRFAFTSILLKTSKLMGDNADNRGRIRKDSLQAQFAFREVNILSFLDLAFKDLLKAQTRINEIKTSDVVLSTQTASDLSMIPADSIDYIFTDPPYGDKVQYWELNWIWERWMQFSDWEEDEIIVCRQRGMSEDTWAKRLKEAFKEMYRVLKAGHYLTLTYHDISTGTWELIKDIAAETGFLIDRSDAATTIETKQKAEKQHRKDININRRDQVVSYRKPALEEQLSANFSNRGFKDAAYEVIRHCLSRDPGTSKDRIYDQVVGRLIRSGAFERHNFDELLSDIAEPAGDDSSRWFLKETEEVKIDAAESAKEDAAADRIKAFVAEALKKEPGHEGVHYSDIFDYYIYNVTEKPRRQLQDLLLDYLYKTEVGAYRLPASEEEEQLKTQARETGTNRRIKRYIGYLQQGVTVPEKERQNETTLAEWIRTAKRSGMYETGKLLFEKGGLSLQNLPDDLMVKVEEDYAVCTRMLARADDQFSTKKPKNS